MLCLSSSGEMVLWLAVAQTLTIIMRMLSGCILSSVCPVTYETASSFSKLGIMSRLGPPIGRWVTSVTSLVFGNPHLQRAREMPVHRRGPQVLFRGPLPLSGWFKRIWTGFDHLGCIPRLPLCAPSPPPPSPLVWSSGETPLSDVVGPPHLLGHLLEEFWTKKSK